MSVSTPVAELPSEKVKKARRTATIIALIATLGPFFYGFEGMVLNGAIKAVAGDFKLGTIAQGL
ncbi:MAG: MFS transporter, partial [Varibaculum cambriense]|nr:MFS transporter [Varibaculum cambriense]